MFRLRRHSHLPRGVDQFLLKLRVSSYRSTKRDTVPRRLICSYTSEPWVALLWQHPSLCAHFAHVCIIGIEPHVALASVIRFGYLRSPRKAICSRTDTRMLKPVSGRQGAQGEAKASRP